MAVLRMKLLNFCFEDWKHEICRLPSGLCRLG